MIAILQVNYLANFSCKFLQDQYKIFQFLQKTSFLVQDLQHLMQDLAILVRKIFCNTCIILQDDFYWVATGVHDQDYCI